MQTRIINGWWMANAVAMGVGWVSGLVSLLVFDEPALGVGYGWLVALLVMYLWFSVSGNPAANPAACLMVPLGLVPMLLFAIDGHDPLVIFFAGWAGSVPSLVASFVFMDGADAPSGTTDASQRRSTPLPQRGDSAIAEPIRERPCAERSRFRDAGGPTAIYDQETDLLSSARTPRRAPSDHGADITPIDELVGLFDSDGDPRVNTDR